ncbi:MAG: DUF1800 family protein [Chloroflexi bacterium]|nr:DUF1800 family protein [Chloroflexota bacterium]
MTQLTRNDFLKLSGLAAAMTALSACQPLFGDSGPSGAVMREAQVLGSPLSGSPDEDWVLMCTLHRISFGPTPNEVERAREIGIENYIDEQLNPERVEETDLPTDILNSLTLLGMNPQELFELEMRGRIIGELTANALLRCAYSKRQLNELMVDFWTNHFNIHAAGNPEGVLKVRDDLEVIRPNALGNFGDLLHASATSPAMLTYLDNASNTKNGPNENYARELLELHTMGVDGGYTQLDVEEVARAFTGWSVVGPRRRLFADGTPGDFVFQANLHDEGEKLVLGKTITSSGIEEGQAIIDLLVDHPSTAEYISTKLVRRFVADEPPRSLITRAAETFTNTSGDIPQVMSTILHSDEFKASLGQKVKRPLEIFVSALRLTNASIQFPNRSLAPHLTFMGQPLYRWETPDGYPDTADAWLGTSGTLSRWNYVLALAFNTMPGVEINWEALVEDTTTHEEIIDQLGYRFIGQTLPEEARQIVLDFAGQIDEEFLLPGIGALILSSPYFQMR